MVRFNWPMYAFAFLAIFAGVFVHIVSENRLVQSALTCMGFGALWFVIGSLVATYCVYDRSDLHRFAWFQRATANVDRSNVIICHSGFEDVSESISTILPQSRIRIFDHFDQKTMSEPSINRARKMFPPSERTESIEYASWPTKDGSVDIVLGILAIHELRAHPEKVAWFREARRSITGSGRVLIVEHLRDLANFVAFGPGFLHFHPLDAWVSAWKASGLREVDRFAITPFLKVFVLAKGEG